MKKLSLHLFVVAAPHKWPLAMSLESTVVGAGDFESERHQVV